MKKLVLIVDDEYGLAEVCAAILTDEGYDTVIATDGEAALSKLAERRPDVMMLDVMMPRLDGPETLQRIRANPTLASLPVIMMTALPAGLPPEELGLYQAVLVKPFSHTTMLAAIRALVG